MSFITNEKNFIAFVNAFDKSNQRIIKKREEFDDFVLQLQSFTNLENDSEVHEMCSNESVIKAIGLYNEGKLEEMDKLINATPTAPLSKITRDFERAIISLLPLDDCCTLSITILSGEKTYYITF